MLKILIVFELLPGAFLPSGASFKDGGTLYIIKTDSNGLASTPLITPTLPGTQKVTAEAMGIPAIVTFENLVATVW
ncbi:hypothetical protein [Streptomyces lavendulae]|uniref:hypothetical protein n=1 Tax=Streptomyces lavendulae TaxID=1914 RepID=UPI0024A48B9E|nr:hypothetical protein [Streptomyces lavendulae]GLW04863.1 hypothetical protein Slala05_84930 [Streptomyces lavendulae subsp. lavendulae]